MTYPTFDLRRPDSIEEALDLRTKYGEETVFLAGGLALGIMLRERLVRPKLVISLDRLKDCRSLDIGKTLRIGSTLTHSALINNEQQPPELSLLRAACSCVGSPAIRNMGTIGGSVCQADASSDTIPALLALDALVELRSKENSRQIPISEFFLGVLTTDIREDEILHGIHVPRSTNAVWGYRKISCTSKEAYAAVTIAVRLEHTVAQRCTNVRIGLGSVSPTPMRATAAEEVLEGQPLTDAVIAEAAHLATNKLRPSSDGQGSADYKRKIAAVWVKRLLEDIRRKRESLNE